VKLWGNCDLETLSHGSYGPPTGCGCRWGEKRAGGKRKTDFVQLERKVRLMYGGKYENLDWGCCRVEEAQGWLGRKRS
jgi:hypothetical protein